ncbi:MAG: hypothetical protein AAF357_08690, partial [Verrucomicrobiota bacterium]
MKSTIRFVSLVLVILFGPFVYFLIRAQEMTYLNWFLALAAILWAILFGIWHLIFGKGRFLKRLLLVGLIAVGLIVISFILGSLLRYEGSASGSSFPKFAWVWEPEDEGASDLDELVQTEVSEEEARLIAAMGDSLDFLGPKRNGVFPEAPFSSDWTTHKPELLWRRPVG